MNRTTLAACTLTLFAAGLLQAQVKLPPPAPETPPVREARATSCIYPVHPAPVEAPDAAEPERLWGELGYLLWWINNGPLDRPLVTTGVRTDPLAGVTGRRGTRVLFGDSGLEYGMFSGLRGSVGGWLDRCGTIGVEGGGFFLERRADGFNAASDGAGNPPLVVPFFDPSIHAQTAAIISSPVAQRFAGTVGVASHSRLWGFHASAVYALNPCGPVQIDALAGYRRLGFDEDLTLDVSNRDLTVDIQNHYADRIAATNRFDGGQIGARVSCMAGYCYLLAQGQVSLGNSSQSINRTGVSLQTGANAFAPGLHAGGILVQPTNAGKMATNVFAVVPSAEARVGLNVLPWLSVSIGYEFLYWSSVVRPGAQLDGAVNATQSAIFGGGVLIGEPRPSPLFERTDFFAHGLRFGVEVYY